MSCFFPFCTTRHGGYHSLLANSALNQSRFITALTACGIQTSTAHHSPQEGHSPIGQEDKCTYHLSRRPLSALRRLESSHQSNSSPTPLGLSFALPPTHPSVHTHPSIHPSLRTKIAKLYLLSVSSSPVFTLFFLFSWFVYLPQKYVLRLYVFYLQTNPPKSRLG